MKNASTNKTKNNLTFIHIPKNAGTAVSNAIGFGSGHYPFWEIIQHDHAKSFAIVRNPFDRIVSSFTYAKMDKSYYHGSFAEHPDYKLLRDKTLKECLQTYRLRSIPLGYTPISLNNINVDLSSKIDNEKHRYLNHQSWSGQCFWICDSDNNILVDEVLKYEDLGDNIYGYPLDLVNKSDRRPTRDYYDDETMDLVRTIYKNDFEVFGYDKNKLP